MLRRRRAGRGSRVASSGRVRRGGLGRIGCLPVLLVALLGTLVSGGAVRAQCLAPLDEAPAGGAPTGGGQTPFGDAALQESVRAEDGTYLTFPEWYIVYSAQEYASALASDPPSGYPYFRSVGQYWCSYNTVFEWSRRRYPFSAGNHLMLLVIGTSYTAEYAIKGVYENTLGRVTEWLSDGGDTEEDRFNAQLWRDYGTFLEHTPWYRFPFGSKLTGLWSETSAWGSYPIRKWERKLALSAEYAVKASYGGLIGLATGAVYTAYEERTLTWMEQVPPDVLAQVSGARVERQVDASTQLVALPRFREFDKAVVGLARRGARFREFAGNDEIMLTAIAPTSWSSTGLDGQLLFEQPILIDPASKRVAINVPVQSLHRVLVALEEQGVRLEHLYDY